MPGLKAAYRLDNKAQQKDKEKRERPLRIEFIYLNESSMLIRLISYSAWGLRPVG
jgi:hypothetical protein